ncbi:uncharacterized protein BKCO1_300052 [Diplodia corticola]|uniref:Uncharacterized protein n=1 Tax=Diplodia corticola TaxID=236234 RepID=A0A1J9SGD6_9PEZI|nr:uncharacterized protein BKCO1_300052 [Diplodia corticola]OJD38860.1 hypothetical protein BKCO1_300052 [Diplodia corticola]
MHATSPTLIMLGLALCGLTGLAQGFAVLPMELNSAVDKRQYNQCEMATGKSTCITFCATEMAHVEERYCQGSYCHVKHNTDRFCGLCECDCHVP